MLEHDVGFVCRGYGADAAVDGDGVGGEEGEVCEGVGRVDAVGYEVGEVRVEAVVVADGLVEVGVVELAADSV